jgi:uncharacterized protein (DUF1800 family)
MNVRKAFRRTLDTGIRQDDAQGWRIKGKKKMTDRNIQAALALHRFGLGPRAGSIAAIGGDPQGALLAELDRPGAGQIVDPDLLASGEALRAAFDFRTLRQERRAEQAQRPSGKAGPGSPTAPPAGAPQNPGMGDAAGGEADAAQNPAMAAPPAAEPSKPKANPGPGVPLQIYREDAKARVDAALKADIGFAERLCWFWSNHFCVSADKGGVLPIAGAYEREAIRPHILGRFADMLMAVETDRKSVV